MERPENVVVLTPRPGPYPSASTWFGNNVVEMPDADPVIQEDNPEACAGAIQEMLAVTVKV